MPARSITPRSVPDGRPGQVGPGPLPSPPVTVVREGEAS